MSAREVAMVAAPTALVRDAPRRAAPRRATRGAHGRPRDEGGTRGGAPCEARGRALQRVRTCCSE